MSKFHKIPIFLIIALVLTFTLASCGKEHEPNPPDPDDINNISEPTEKFIDFVDDCFENYDFVQVYNSEGTEMTVVALLDKMCIRDRSRTWLISSSEWTPLKMKSYGISFTRRLSGDRRGDPWYLPASPP